MNFKRGDFVKNLKAVEWGVGEILSCMKNHKYKVYFEEVGEKIVDTNIADLKRVERKGYIRRSIIYPEFHCPECHESIIQRVQDVQKHFVDVHSKRISEKEAVNIIHSNVKSKTKDHHEGSTSTYEDYYFPLTRRPEIYVVTPGSGKKRR